MFSSRTVKGWKAGEGRAREEDISPAEQETNTGKDKLPLGSFKNPRCWNRVQAGGRKMMKGFGARSCRQPDQGQQMTTSCASESMSG